MSISSFNAFQIDIGPELASRIIHKSQVFSSNKKIPREQKDPSLFDEAQSILYKEMLPYWAGFCKQYRPPTDEHNTRLPRKCCNSNNNSNSNNNNNNNNNNNDNNNTNINNNNDDDNNDDNSNNNDNNNNNNINNDDDNNDDNNNNNNNNDDDNDDNDNA